MKIIYMGTPDFSVPAIKSLIDAGHEIKCVVTQPDKQRGRGKKVLYTPVKEEALKYDIEVLQPEKVRERDFIEKLRGYEADVMVVIAFGQILPKEVLEMTKYGCINVHASLLPKYRGAAPIQWAVIDGEKESGVTTMQMDEGLDTGDILEVSKVVLDEKETGGSLFDKLSEEGAKLIVSTLDKLEKNEIVPVEQRNEESNYASMIKKDMGKIDFSKDAVSIERLIRGLNPWPSAYTYFNGKTLKLWECDVLDKDYEGEFGEVVDVDKERIYVKTGDKTLVIKELQLEGKKRMKTLDFLLGNQVSKGYVLG
ncbi:methionyl-tRNA formyltransferase [Lachnospiraceae bacterium RM5]|nr:methionyl-tRNA formyltransferase [Lachnospiraceae bacterium RM5]